MKAAHYLLFLIPFEIGFLIFNRGFYHQGAFFLLVLTFLLFCVYLLNPKQEFRDTKEVETAVFLVSLFSAILALFFVQGFYQKDGWRLNLNYIILCISIFIIFTYKFDLRTILIRYRFAALIFLNIIARILVISGSASPPIDVLDLTKKGPQAIIEGKNPYDLQYSKIYEDQDPYTFYRYPPTSLIFLTPVVAVFSEPRILFIILEILSAFMLYRLLVKKISSKTISELVPTVYLFFPLTFFILEQSWIDPLASFLIILFAYITTTYQKFKFLPAIVLTLALLTKQYLVILPIFFVTRWKRYGKILVLSFCIFGVLLLMFLVFVPEMFKVYSLGFEFRFESLGLASFLHKNFKVTMTIPAFYLLWILLTGAVMFKRPIKDYQHYLLMSFWLLGFFLFNFSAFVNEYYLSYTTLILAYVLSFES